MLEEHEVVDELGENKPETIRLIQPAKQIGDLNNEPVWRQSYGDQDICVLGPKDEPLAYAIFEKKEVWWGMEIRAFVKGHGYGTALYVYLIKNLYEQVYCDESLTTDSIKMIERIISKGLLNASIYDKKNNRVVAYDPVKGINIPMYDLVIPGINRQPLSSDHAKRFVWVLETRARRSGILQEYIRFGPNK